MPEMTERAEIYDYDNCLINLDIVQLLKLPKLTREQIAIHYPCDGQQYYNIHNRIFLYICYGYYDELDLYDNSDLLNSKIDILAIRLNKLKPIKYLESRGFDFKNDEYFFTAAHNDAIKTMKYLKSLGINMNVKDDDGSNAFFMASNLKIFKFLKSNNVNINCINIYGTNAFFEAIKLNNIKIMKFFQSYNLNIHIKDRYFNMNAYLEATYYSGIKMLKYLESLGSFIHFCDKRGENAFTMALYSGNTKLIKYIKSRGINIYKKLSYYPLIIYENPNKKQLISVLYIRDKTKYIMNYIT